MRWSPRVRIPLLPKRLLVLNWGRRGFSISSKLGWFTFNSKGGYSVNGPGIADFRGRWKKAPTRSPHTRGPRVGTRGKCGATKCGASPCKLDPHDGGWHIPSGGEDPWRDAWGQQ